jgi:hypothetical protein
MRRLVTIVAIAVSFALMGGETVSAQVRLAQMRSVIALCAGDYQRLCPGVPPGGGRILVCLNSQAEKLSQPCFQALAQQGLGTAAALRLCQSDYARLCPGMPPGDGRALACLLASRDRVSPGCDNALAAHGFEAGSEPAPPPRR